jgi:hypothetical protein
MIVFPGILRAIPARMFGQSWSAGEACRRTAYIPRRATLRIARL